MRMMMNKLGETCFAARWRHGLLPLMMIAGMQALPAWAQDSEVLVKVEVVGARKQAPETVLFKSGVNVGDDLRTLDLTAVLERLWATGAFEDIKFEVEDAEGGKKLLIRVVERSIIKAVEYHGGTVIGVSNITKKVEERKLVIQPDTVYDPEAARKIKGLIVELCGEKGFRTPVVDVNLEPIAPGLARLVFDVKEGGKVKIYKIAFRGNTVIPSSKLKSALKKITAHGFFGLSSKDLLVEKNIDEDLQNIKKAYWRLGYKDVFVGQPIIEVVDRTKESQKKKNEKLIKDAKSPKYDLRATVTIPILEGEKYYAGHLKIEGEPKVFKGQQGEILYRTAIAEAERNNRSSMSKLFGIAPTLEEKPGAKPRPFDLDALNEGVEKIREAYGNQAYIMFRADKKLEVREEGGLKKVDVTLAVDEGEMYTVRRIGFEGNTLTKDKVIRRTLLVKEGDPFRVDRFRESFTGVSQLGFFEVKDQEPKVDIVPEKPQVDLTIKGEEAGTKQIMFNAGYGQTFGATAGASFSTRNLGGSGESLTVSANVGKLNREFSIGFNEPYLFDLPYSFSVDFHNRYMEYSASRVGAGNAYTTKSSGIGTSVGTRLSTFFPEPVWAYYTSYSVGYNLDLVKIGGGSNYYYRDTSSQMTSSVGQSITYSTVNHPFKPTSGTKLSLGFAYGGWQFGTDKPFHRTTLEFGQFGCLAQRHIFGYNISYGYIKNLGNEDLPFYNLYRPGGEGSVRGYKQGLVGSMMPDNNGNPVVIGGNKQIVFNAEYQFQIAEMLRAVLFYDAGNAWAPGEKILNRDEVRYTPYGSPTASYKNPRFLQSVGIELRLFLPISPAPLRLIWAKKLNPYPFDPNGKFNFEFSLGTTF